MGGLVCMDGIAALAVPGSRRRSWVGTVGETGRRSHAVLPELHRRKPEARKLACRNCSGSPAAGGLQKTKTAVLDEQRLQARSAAVPNGWSRNCDSGLQTLTQPRLELLATGSGERPHKRIGLAGISEAIQLAFDVVAGGAGREAGPGMDPVLRPLRHGWRSIELQNSVHPELAEVASSRGRKIRSLSMHIVPRKAGFAGWFKAGKGGVLGTVCNAPCSPFEVHGWSQRRTPLFWDGLPRRTPQAVTGLVAKANVLAPGDEHKPPPGLGSATEASSVSAQLLADEGVGQGGPNLHPDLRPLREDELRQIVKRSRSRAQAGRDCVVIYLGLLEPGGSRSLRRRDFCSRTFLRDEEPLISK